MDSREKPGLPSPFAHADASPTQGSRGHGAGVATVAVSAAPRMPWPELKAFRDRLTALHLPHALILPYMVFLKGLHQAALAHSCTPANANPSTHPLSISGSGICPWTPHAAQSLKDAVEFSLQEQSQSLVKSPSSIAGDTAFQCLFMGVAYAQSNHPPEVFDRLYKGSFEDNLTQLLHAMGVLSWTTPQARRLTTKITPNLTALIQENFGSDAANLFA